MRPAATASGAAMGSRPARFNANASRSISSRSSSTSRIRTALPIILGLTRGVQQGEPHGRPAARLAVDADTAAVSFDDALGDSEPKAHARCISIGPHTIETLEQTDLLLGR